MDWIFADVKNAKLPIFGDLNSWDDYPAHKPYSFEFMELLNINNFENGVLRPTHASGHTLDWVLLPVDSGVHDLNVLFISSSIFGYDMVAFHVNFPKAYSFTKSVTFMKYQSVADGSNFRNIE